MKKILFCLAVCVLMGVKPCSAQSADMDQFLNELSEGMYNEVLEKVATMSMTMPSEGGNFSFVTYAVKEDCAAKEKIRDIMNVLGSLKDNPDYPLLMQTKKEGRLVDAYMKTDEVNGIVNAVIVGLREGELEMIISLSGSVSEDEMTEFVNTLNI